MHLVASCPVLLYPGLILSLSLGIMKQRDHSSISSSASTVGAATAGAPSSGIKDLTLVSVVVFHLSNGII